MGASPNNPALCYSLPCGRVPSPRQTGETRHLPLKEAYAWPRIAVTQLTRQNLGRRCTRSDGVCSLPDMIKDLINDLFG